MALSMDWQNLVLDAVFRYFQPLLSSHVHVEIGWVENEEFKGTRAKGVFAIEALSPDRDLAPADVRSWTTPAESATEPKSDLLVDYGSGIVPLVANLYVVDGDRRGRARRGELLKKIEDAFPIEPGEPQQIRLQLDNPEQTIAVLTLEDVELRDEPEGTQRNEWRAILRMQARHALEATIEKPFCRTIQLGEDEESLRPVNSIG